MKKLIYILASVTFIFTSCKKEQGCTDEKATNYNIESEEDDGSCVYSISGGTWTTESIESVGTMSVSMMGIPILDSTINYLETNSDSLDPYQLVFELTDPGLDQGSYTEFDQLGYEVEQGSWSLSGDQLTINSPDTTLVLTVNSVSKSDASISLLIDESETDATGFSYDVNLNQTLYLNREY